MESGGAAAARGLSVAWVVDAGRVSVTVSGEVDITSCSTLDSVFDQVLAGGVGSVVVDLGGVTFLDSAGMRTLVVGQRRAVGQGATFRVANVRGAAELMLSIVGVLRELTGTA